MSAPLVPLVRVVREGTVDYRAKQRVGGAADVLTLVRPVLDDRAEEAFVAVPLDGKGRALGVHVVSVGCLTAAIVHPREVFKLAVLCNAASLIVAHNHPSGDPAPSAEDHAITRRLVQAGEVLGIRLTDHVVVGDNGAFYSFAAEGQI